jgi:hypothetical protein
MSSISAGTTSGTALVSSGDTTGTLIFKTNGTTTAVTIGADQVVTLAQPLPVASGGTGGSVTPTAGGVVYGTGTVQAVTSAGTSGQFLQSNGAGAPTWATPSSGSFTAKTANYTAVSGDNILANTSAGSWTLTLPATPATGSVVQVMDSIGTFGVYPLTVGRNGSTIMSAAENMTMDVNGAATTFVYNGSTWRVI